MTLTYGTSAILFALKILPFQHVLLLWSPSLKLRYGHSSDNAHENVSGYELGLTVFVLYKNYDACFYSFYSYQLRTVAYFQEMSFQTLQRLSKELVYEQTRFNLKAGVYGIRFLQWKGWHELDCEYWWLSIHLT